MAGSWANIGFFRFWHSRTFRYLLERYLSSVDVHDHVETDPRLHSQQRRRRLLIHIREEKKFRTSITKATHSSREKFDATLHWVIYFFERSYSPFVGRLDSRCTCFASWARWSRDIRTLIRSKMRLRAEIRDFGWTFSDFLFSLVSRIRANYCDVFFFSIFLTMFSKLRVPCGGIWILRRKKLIYFR